MQKLHLVGFTADHQGLIFSSRRGSKSGGFIVPLSEGLLDAIDALRSGHDVGPAAVEDPKPPRAESSLSVREVQARLRVGRSIAEVAKEAGVDQEWVERFAIPVIAEQRRVIDEAHALHLEKRGRGESAMPLGEAVRWNVGSKGIAVTEDEYQAAWSAHQVHDTRWLLRFRYRSRGHDQVAAWDYDQATGALASRERLGTALGFVEPGAEMGPAPRARGSTSRRRAAAVRSARKATAPTKRTAKKAATKKAATKRAVTKKGAPKKAAMRKKAAPRKAASRKKAAPRKATTARKATGRKRTPPAAPQVAVATTTTPAAAANGDGDRARRQLRAR